MRGWIWINEKLHRLRKCNIWDTKVEYEWVSLLSENRVDEYGIMEWILRKRRRINELVKNNERCLLYYVRTWKIHLEWSDWMNKQIYLWKTWEFYWIKRQECMRSWTVWEKKFFSGQTTFTFLSLEINFSDKQFKQVPLWTLQMTLFCE